MDTAATVAAVPKTGKCAPSEAIQRSLVFMQSNLVEAITLRQLASVADLSVLQFSATFRREVGIPPYRYLSQLRIKLSTSLLDQGLSVAAVAAETGFFDQSHLYRHFKRVQGVTPRQYQASIARRGKGATAPESIAARNELRRVGAARELGS